MKTDLAVAIGTWLVAGALLAIGPPVDSGVAGVPALGAGLWWACLLVLAVQAALLVLRRRRPLPVLVGVAAGPLVLAVLGTGDVASLGGAAVLVAVWSAVTAAGGTRLILAVTSAGVLVGAGTYVGQTDNGLTWASASVAALLQAVGAVGLPALLASAVSSRRDAQAARTDLAVALAHEHSALVAAAIAQERMAMARELHDIAAHHLTGIAVMTGAVERQIDTDPSGAKTAVRQVRNQSTSMLRELRGLVGLLRDTDAENDGQASLSGIPELVEEARALGRDVRLERLGPDPTGVGPLAQLAAYRTVQEALSNAARHAPGARCEVAIDTRDPAEVVVTVRNGVPPRGEAVETTRPGVGLVGMRERAQLTDADLDAGPTPDGGWQVTLRMPAAVLEEVAG